ncbi:MAG: M24 family metallopeptidase [Thermoguttaceae bacterium]|jgi:Xaa-Pro aminopeptidase
MTHRFDERRDKLRRLIRKSAVDSLLVTDFTNVTYLTGFTGDDSFLLIHRDGAILISDGRYVTQLQEECPGLDLHIRATGTTIAKAAIQVAESSGVGRLGIEADSMAVSLRDQLAERLAASQIVSTTGFVEALRQVKDKEEIAQVRRAIWYAEKAFEVLRATLRPEKTEKQVADELEMQMRMFGAKCASFPSIVAAGPRAALPHAQPGQCPIGQSDLLLVDWGADGGLYQSDLTRVLVTGRISPKLERIYRVVLQAQTQAIAAVRPGVRGEEIDGIARGVIGEAGFGKYFDHGLGHGLGLAVHEGPRLRPSSEVVLEPGMIVTVEPGIYLPGWGGVRIEDDLLVTRTGHEILTSLPKQWEQMFVSLN